MRDFSRRSTERELMDDGGISFAEFHHCLRSLEIINHLTLAYRPTLNWLRPWIRCKQGFTLLDAGSGGGDMLRQIAKRLPTDAQQGRVKLIGVDLNPWSQQSAHLARRFSVIENKTGDIFSFTPEQSIDLVICSLFTHHLTDAEIIDFLRWIDHRAKRGWFINDLHRHAIPFYFIKVATALFSRNRLIRSDAAVSVARAFSVADWHRLLAAAGIGERAKVRWRFPFRVCISCEKH